MGDKTADLNRIGNYAIELIRAIDGVKAERDDDNQPLNMNSAPVMLSQLVEPRPHQFIRHVLESYREQVVRFWPVDMVDDIKAEHRLLVKPIPVTLFFEMSSTIMSTRHSSTTDRTMSRYQYTDYVHSVVV